MNLFLIGGAPCSPPDGLHSLSLRSGRAAATVFVAAAFVLRLLFGLLYEFWADDELQIFLIGLQYATTGEWPYFGADVVYSQTRIPGALMGLLVGAPLRLVGAPEAPYVLLNVLSACALALLAWYIGRRNPGVPRWFLWLWIFFAPWALNFSTHIVNPSYVLVGAVVFFVGAFELLPGVTVRVLPPALSFACLGFGLLWVAQLHLSYPILVPFVLAALATAAARGWRDLAHGVLWFVAGAALPAAALIPTLAAYGLASAASTTGANVVVDFSNLLRIPEVVARFLSFASAEIPRFLGNNTATRLEFITRHPWSAPFATFATIVGLLQPFVLFLAFFRLRHPAREWRPVAWLTAVTLAMTCASFVFSVKDPASHAFYLLFPVAMLYAFYCWEVLLQRRWLRIAAAALLVSAGAIHIAIAIDHAFTRSLYKDRSLVVRAIEERNYRLLGERRPVLWESGKE